MADGESRFAGKVEEFRVKKFFYPAVFLTFAAGCSTPTATVENKNSNSGSTAISRTIPATNQAIPPPANQSNSNVENPANANKIVVEDLGAINRRNLERLKSKGGGDTNAAPIAAVTPAPSVAPDNSEVSSTMNEKGVPIETRVFKNHPLLVKMEKSFADIEKPVIKVYLKNGKVLIAPNDKISNTATVPADEILRLVGVKP
jgi:hypothetical protein